MRKNGFTLIELLAVIVILAIIALIATPIILGIINDAREKANERSVELYAAAVKNGIAAYQLTGLNAPKSFSDLTIQYDGDVKCSVQELYEDGSFYLDGCKVNNGEKEYSYGTKQVVKGTMSICNPAEEQLYANEPLESGYTYECKVDPNKPEYTFYVLNSDGTSVNLIMNSNINSDGTIATKAITKEDASQNNGKYNLVAWISKLDYGCEDDYCEISDKGPITAMNFLQEATKNWTNTNKIIIDAFDAYKYNVDNGDHVYLDTYEMVEYVANARMPYLNEIERANESNKYLYDYLDLEYWDVNPSYKPTNNISGIRGYWTLSARSNSIGLLDSWAVFVDGYPYFTDYVGNDNEFGVRPVINLSI